MEKGFFKLGGEGGCILSPLEYLLDGNVNIHMWFTKSDIFFVVCIVLTFQKILLGGILDGPFLSLTGCGFWVFIP